MSRAKLLLPAPRPTRTARWPFVVVGGVFACAVSAAMGWKVGVRTSWDGWVAAEREAVVAQDMLEQCLSAEGRVTTSAIHAGVAVLRMQRFLEDQADYADMMTSREYVAEATP